MSSPVRRLITERTLWGLAVLSLLVLLWAIYPAGKPQLRLREGASLREDSPAAQAQERAALAVRLDAERPALTSIAVPASPERAAALAGEYGRSPLADALHDPQRTARQDLQVVLDLCTQYRVRYQGFPVGEDNATITNALAGQNPQHLAFLPRDHPAIDAQGQLVDRWQQPYFFHLLGRDALEIRSAGPDRELYTADDQLVRYPPGSPTAEAAPSP